MSQAKGPGAKSMIERGRNRIDTAMKEASLPNHFNTNISLILGNHDKGKGKSSRFKQDQTQRRCKELRLMSHTAIVSWATAYPPTSWRGGRLGKPTFDELVLNIDLSKEWQPVVLGHLNKLKAKSQCQKICDVIFKFLQSWGDWYPSAELRDTKLFVHLTAIPQAGVEEVFAAVVKGVQSNADGRGDARDGYAGAVHMFVPRTQRGDFCVMSLIDHETGWNIIKELGLFQSK
ncbi:hypothetical protein LTR95_015724 [Oleoguttula sp. CCFEE 5521]